jgi:hypothetical protein
VPRCSRRKMSSGRNPVFRVAVAASLRSWAFLITAAVLLSAAVGLQATAKFLDWQFRKQPIPLKKSLKLMDRDALGPYRFVRALSLEPEEEQGLGTSEYIQWVLEDTSVDEDSPVRAVRLFITYYTGLPDQVPHVPDVCFLGGGYKTLQGATERFEVPELEELGYDPIVPYRAMTFEKSGLLRAIRPTVVYTFGVNGKLAGERFAVRKAMSSLFDRYAYFSKVEVTFGHKELPERAAAIEAGQRALATVLPVLIRDHWPDFESGAARDPGEDEG